MEKLGQPRFFSSHSASVRSVAFSPTDRHLFCSVGNDGNVCIYHAGRAELLSIFPVINSGVNRHVVPLDLHAMAKRYYKQPLKII